MLDSIIPHRHPSEPFLLNFLQMFNTAVRTKSMDYNHMKMQILLLSAAYKKMKRVCVSKTRVKEYSVYMCVCCCTKWTIFLWERLTILSKDRQTLTDALYVSVGVQGCCMSLYVCRLFISVCLCGIFIADSPTWRQMRNRKWACMEEQQFVCMSSTTFRITFTNISA